MEKQKSGLLKDRMTAILEAGQSLVNRKVNAIALLGIVWLLTQPVPAHGDIASPVIPSDEAGYNTFLSYHGTQLADELGITGEGSVIVVFDSGIAPYPSFTPLFEACVAVAGEPVCTDGPGVHFGPGVATHDYETSWHGDRVSETAHITAQGAYMAPVSIVDGEESNNFENLTGAIPAVLDYLQENYPNLRPVMMYAAALPVQNGQGVLSLDCDDFIPELTRAIQEARARGIPFITPLPLEELEPKERMYPACIEGTVPVVGVEGSDLHITAADGAKIDKPMVSASISVDIVDDTREFVGRGHSHAVAVAAGMGARLRQAEGMTDNTISLLDLSSLQGLPIRDENGQIVPDLSFLHVTDIRSALGLDAYKLYFAFAGR